MAELEAELKSRSMRIAVCAPQVPFVRGGAEIFTDKLVEELRARGHETAARHDPLQVVSRHEGARARRSSGASLDLEEADGRADRPRRRDEVPLLLRPPSEQARLGAAPVPPGLRARPNRSGPVRRRTGGPGVAALGPNPRPGRSRRGAPALRDLPQRRRADRALDRPRGRGDAASAAGAPLPLRGVRRLRPLGQPARPREADRPADRGGRARSRPARRDHGRGPRSRAARRARARAWPQRPRRVRRARRRGGARLALRALPRRLLRAGRRGLRDGAVRGVPLPQARADDDRRGRAARDRQRPRTGLVTAPEAPALAAAAGWLREHPGEAEAFGAAGHELAARVTWDGCIDRLLA